MRAWKGVRENDDGNDDDDIFVLNIQAGMEKGKNIHAL